MRLAVEVDDVAGTVRLGLQVEAIVLVGGDDVGDAVAYRDAVAHELLDLAGIVGEQADRAHGEARDHVRRDGVVALVVTEAERQVGIDGVEPAVLERVGPDLVQEADAASLLPQVEQHAAGFLGDAQERDSRADPGSRTGASPARRRSGTPSAGG